MSHQHHHYNELLKLNTGASFPAVGLGTWQSKPHEVAAAVEVALKAGYRHIDGAWIYGNESEVGEGIRKSGVPREQIFVTTKLWATYHRNPLANLELSLQALGLDYVDLYLMHWPIPMNPKGDDPKFPKRPDGSRDLDDSWTYIQTWHEMQKLLATGKVKAIGLSNSSIPFIEALLADPHTTVVPAANQVESHPYLPQHELVDYCKSKGIVFTAYSPLGSTNSPLLQDEDVKKIAHKHGAEVGQVLISWQVHRGVAVLPKSVTPHRIQSNFIKVNLDAEDAAVLDNLHKKTTQRIIKPAWGVDLKFPVW